MSYEVGQRYWLPVGDGLEILGVKSDGTMACCDRFVTDDLTSRLHREHTHVALPLPDEYVPMELPEEVQG